MEKNNKRYEKVGKIRLIKNRAGIYITLKKYTHLCEGHAQPILSKVVLKCIFCFLGLTHLEY